MKIGVLALQGAVSEHINAFSSIGVESIPIRLPSELAEVKALVIPGGESTTISRLMLDYALLGSVRQLVLQGVPIFGTCAGLILLAKKVRETKIETIGVLDVVVKRNAYGRQINSFETKIDIPVLGTEPFPAIFIRAPIIESVGNGVEILARLNGVPVAVRQGKIVACSFHPELTGDLRFHRYFMELVKEGSRPLSTKHCTEEPLNREGS